MPKLYAESQNIPIFGNSIAIQNYFNNCHLNYFRQNCALPKLHNEKNHMI